MLGGVTLEVLPTSYLHYNLEEKSSEFLTLKMKLNRISQIKQGQ